MLAAPLQRAGRHGTSSQITGRAHSVYEKQEHLVTPLHVFARPVSVGGLRAAVLVVLRAVHIQAPDGAGMQILPTIVCFPR